MISPIEYDSELLDWRYDPAPLAGFNSTFGNIVPVDGGYHLFCHDLTNSVVTEMTGPTPRAFSGVTTALGKGVTGTPDDTACGVPFMWYEAGEARPWRALYRAGRAADSFMSICLATKTDGGVWERKAPDGSPLPYGLAITAYAAGISGVIRITVAAHPWSTGDRIMVGGTTGTGSADVINKTSVNVHYWTVTKVDGDTLDLQGSTYNAGNSYSGGLASQSQIQVGVTGQWDYSDIDFGSVIKVGATYYVYYDTISLPRKTGVAYSTDLVHWTKHANNPFLTGVTDYDDKNHNGAVDLSAGFYCPDIVKWPRADGSDRFVLITPHNPSSGDAGSYDIYESDTVLMRKSDRTYIGKVFDSGPLDKMFQGFVVTSIDVPRIVCNDIFRDVTSVPGDDILMTASLKTSDAKWHQAMLVQSKTLAGSVLSNVCADLPITAPAHTLAPKGVDSTTKGLWLPGLTGTLRELSGMGAHLEGQPSLIDASGVKFSGVAASFAQWTSTGTLDALNAITGDFTVECRFSLASAFTASYRTLIGYTGGVGAHHFNVYLGGNTGPNYKIYLSATSGSTSRTTAGLSLGNLTVGQLYRLAISRTGGMIYFFLDGVLVNVGGTAYAYVIDSTPTAPFRLGSAPTTTYYWDGYIDEVRISDTARWITNYTPSALTFNRQTSGSIITPVYDLGAAYLGNLNLSVSTPANTTITRKVRQASSFGDRSSSIGDFTNMPPLLGTRYQQFAVTLATTDATQTPSVIDAVIGGSSPANDDGLLLGNNF